MALRAAAHDAAPGLVPPTLEEALGIEAVAVRDVVFRLASQRAFAAQDLSRLDHWWPLGETLSTKSLSRRLALVRRAYLRGERLEDHTLATIESDAQRDGDASTLVDACAVRALAALDRGAREEGRGLARRAVRMARTEELPQSQYLAGIALARARRFSEQPHLSIRILKAVRRVASPHWCPWLDWELLLCGAAPPEGGSGLAAQLPPGWGRGSVRERLSHLVGLSPDGPPSWLQEMADVRSLVLLDEPPNAAMAPWVEGRVDVLPRGYGALTHLDPDSGAHVLVRPDGPARRVLDDSLVCSSVPRISTSRPGRLETATSVLALANGPMPLSTFFSSVYGFEFKPAMHRGSLEVLVHRTRDLLGGHGRIERPEAHQIVLNVTAPFVVPDPRCERALDNTILSAVAHARSATARESARSVGVSLRSVQRVLERLVEEGACVVERSGRHVRYRVEDTTFSEPTRNFG